MRAAADTIVSIVVALSCTAASRCVLAAADVSTGLLLHGGGVGSPGATLSGTDWLTVGREMCVSVRTSLIGVDSRWGGPDAAALFPTCCAAVSVGGGKGGGGQGGRLAVICRGHGLPQGRDCLRCVRCGWWAHGRPRSLVRAALQLRPVCGLAQEVEDAEAGRVGVVRWHLTAHAADAAVYTSTCITGSQPCMHYL